MPDGDPGAGPSAPWERRDTRLLFLFVLTFVAWRIGWLATNPSSVGYWEESYRWFVAHDLLGPRQLPFLEYQADHYQGGTLVMPLLVAPFFALLGESTFSLKLAAIAFSAGTLILLYVIGRRFLDRRSAVLAALSLLAGPPLVAYMGLVVMGSHGESVLFSLLQVLALLSLLRGRRAGTGGWLVLGVISGIGLWFCYTTVISLGACGLAWLVLRGPPGPRPLLAATGGGLIGLAPWLVYNVRYDFRGLRRIGEVLGFGDPIDLASDVGTLERLVKLALHDLPQAAIEPFAGTFSPPAAVALMVAFALPFGILAVLPAVRIASAAWKGGRAAGVRGLRAGLRDREPEVLFVAYELVFVVVFLLSDMVMDEARRPHGYRLLMPPLVFGSLLMASAAGRLWNRGGARRALAGAAVGICLAASVTGTAAMMLRAPEGHQVLSPSTGQAVMGVLLHRKYENEIGRAFAVVDRLRDAGARRQAWAGIGWGMETRFEKDGGLEEFRARLRLVPAEARPHVLAGSHYFTRASINDHLARNPDAAAASDEDRRTLERLRTLDRFLSEERSRYARGDGAE